MKQQHVKQQHVVIVGAGVVGLSVAWFLQEHGCSVTVVDRTGPGAGASHGNAGWAIPQRAVPLPEPAALREGVLSLFDPRGALHLPGWWRPQSWPFLLEFARNCTAIRSQRAQERMAQINDVAADALDQLTSSGLVGPIVSSPIIAAFADERDAAHLPVGADLSRLEHGEARALAPLLNNAAKVTVRMNEARSVEPALFVESLAADVLRRGGDIAIADIASITPGPTAITADGRRLDGDAVVVATGARLGAWSRTLGLHVPIAAGRGYSFVVPTDEPVPSPVYLPAQRLACTPVDGGLRVAGIMEIVRPEAAPSPCRFEQMAQAGAELLGGLDWEARRDEWWGDRPLTADGLPLIGQSKIEGVFVAGGHGMWGVTQGPVTGRLVADLIATGSSVPTLDAFSPLRRPTVKETA